MDAPFSSDHFTLRCLGEGIWAALVTETGGGGSNAALIDLGDRTLVFDSFENPQPAADLWRACLQLTGRQADGVIISHFHPDHWAGLQVFAGCPILATHATRQAMLPFVAEMAADKGDPSRLENALREAEARLAAESDPRKRQALHSSIARQRYTLEALPRLEPTLPNQTFEGKLAFHGRRRSLEVIATGKGHTHSDCILRLKDAHVTFLGDIGFFQSQPFMADCFPPEWLALLEEMSTWEGETFVPGHGPLGDKADLKLEADYIRALEALVAQGMQAGGSVEDALQQVLPPPFDAWQGIGRRFETNVRAAYRRHAGGGKG